MGSRPDWELTATAVWTGFPAVVAAKLVLGGKVRAGQDEKAGKATYPAVWGIEASREELFQAITRALTSLEWFGEEAEPLRKIARFIANREK